MKNLSFDKDEKIISTVIMDGEWLIATTKTIYRYDKDQKALVPVPVAGLMAGKMN